MVRAVAGVSILFIILSGMARAQEPAMAPVPAVAPATVPATQPVVVDPSNPKGTLTLLARATQGGDAAGVRALLHATNPVETRLADVFSERTQVFAKLRAAAAKAFGEQAATQLTGTAPDDVQLAERRISQSEVKIQDNKAIVQMKPEMPGEAPEPMELVLVDGKWKLPMAVLTEGMPAAQIDEKLAQLKVLSTVVSELTGEIDQGKFKSIQEVDDALKGKLASALLSAPPATGTSTAPAGQ